jgi:membrane fusion protein, multidrug efflux system
MNSVNPQFNKNSSRWLFIIGILLLFTTVVVFQTLLSWQQSTLREEAQARENIIEAGRHVRVATATRSSEERPIVLVGEARPYATVTLYGKVSGYLSEIMVDKGDHVKSGKILAIIESPELHRQYDAALADAKNKRADAERAKGLLQSGALSPQNYERADTAAQVAEETAASILAQTEYEIIHAPFSGTITARFADPGALVQSAATNQTSALPIVTLSQTEQLKVYVYPDQKTASLIQVGDRAEVSDASRPEVKLSAVVSRTSGELDLKTRTLLVQIDLDNKDNRILAGSFVQVHLFVKSPPCVEVPAQALVIRKDKTFIGVVTPDNTIALRPVDIYESDGKVVKLRSGVEEGEQVALNEGYNIQDGDHVFPVVANVNQSRQ